MEASDAQPGAANSGRHRAPDGDAQTAFIPRVTGGVPGGPLDPAAALGASAPWPPAPSAAAPFPEVPPAGPQPMVPHPSSPPQDFAPGPQPMVPHPSSPPQDFAAGSQPAAPHPSSPASARPVGGDAPVSAADTAVLPTNPPAGPDPVVARAAAAARART